MGSPGENKKLARDFSGSSKKQKDHQLNLHPDQEGQGINHDDLVEPTPNYINAPCEKVIQGKNNQIIVLGRDRPGQLGSGYGGSGHTQAGSIDLIVGPTFLLLGVDCTILLAIYPKKFFIFFLRF